MGLQNLKSAFANLVDSSEIEGRHSESPIETIPIVPSSINSKLLLRTLIIPYPVITRPGSIPKIIINYFN